MRVWLARLLLGVMLAIGHGGAVPLPFGGVLPAFAQETTATITGIVTDESGGVLPGVTVTIKETRTGRSFEFVTTETGAYTAPLLPVGDYEITFSLSGFQSQTLRGFRLSVNDRVTINGKLSVGGVAETIEVTAGATLVQQSPALQSLVGSTQVQELPLNNRNFVQLATLAPGVSSDLPDEVGIGLASIVSMSVNGARRNAINWNVDGVSNVDVGSNITLLSTPTLESIEEFKIITNGYAAEHPRSGGGMVNVVTKAGTQQFTGSAYEFFRNDALNANSFIRNQSPDPALHDAPFLRYNNFGYTIGGPIVREKVFFFWSEEWRRIKRASITTANVPNPTWLTDPSSANYVAPGQRDPNAVRLLDAWPQPNLPALSADGPGRFINSDPAIQNTRQEVVRVDYDLNPRWKLTGRYTHDLSETRELGGLFFNTAVPNVATTDTDVPGQVFAAQLRTIVSSDKLNEVSVQYSSNAITDVIPEGTRNKRSDYGLTIPELFSENAGGIMPIIDLTPGLSLTGANQLFDIGYVNWTVSDNFSWQKGNHAFKVGGLATWEQKNENAASVTQGRFAFVAAGGLSAFQNFLTGNRAALCPNCTYTEAERDIDLNLRFSRYEMYAQDSWRLRPRVTLDYGVRYSLYPPVKEKNDLLVTFDPALYDAARAPQFANAAGSLIDTTTGDLLVGIIQAGRNSPFGRGIYEFKKNSVQPRVGLAWDASGTGETVLRGAYGIYYDQPLVGNFEVNAFTTPPIVTNVTLNNAQFASLGTTATTSGVRAVTASATDFENPRMQQWNLTVSRRVVNSGVVEVSYVGSRGDNLIRPTDINYPQPDDVVALQNSVAGAVNPARPFRSYGAIRFHETTAKSRYHGLLSTFRYEGGRNGTLTVNYTLSRNQTDSTNDRDTIDVPQNPLDPQADYADARTDRRHIFTASYIYELPFYREATNALLKGTLGGWQLAGLVYASSGQPVPRVSVSTNNFRRGGFADLVGDINEGRDDTPTGIFWFNPAAFAPPADGTFGNSGRAPFRQTGFSRWDITLSKNFYPYRDTRLQFRVDFINAFNQVNWLANPTADGLDNTCTTSITTCVTPQDSFGQLLQVRAPREIQLGFKLYW